MEKENSKSGWHYMIIQKEDAVGSGNMIQDLLKELQRQTKQTKTQNKTKQKNLNKKTVY